MRSEYESSALRSVHWTGSIAHSHDLNTAEESFRFRGVYIFNLRQGFSHRDKGAAGRIEKYGAESGGDTGAGIVCAAASKA